MVTPRKKKFALMVHSTKINIFIKTGKKKKSDHGQLFHNDLQGKREFKYENLRSSTFKTLPWKKIEYTVPNYFFTPKNFDEIKDYEKGFKIDELLNSYSVGIETQRDSICIQFEKSKIEDVIFDFKNLTVNEIRIKYKLEKDGRDWQLETAKNDVLRMGGFCKLFYRPFDLRSTYFTGKSKGFMAYPRSEIMNYLFEKNNVSLIICKQQSSFDFQHIFVTKYISDGNSISIQTKERASVFPLYRYSKTHKQLSTEQTIERTPNLNTEIVKQIAQKLGLTFSNEKETKKDTFAPIDILDYIYAVLHSPTYREKYKEFLKIDFPRVPYPKDSTTFWKLVKLGGEIRQIHLLESAVVEKYITQYPIDGDNLVVKTKYENGKVYINDTQYFANVPEVAWNFYIGGYQPAQKWLKDRKDRKLEFEDILHYQKIIVALTETDRLMKEIDKIEIAV
jgi:predicted helicase